MGGLQKHRVLLAEDKLINQAVACKMLTSLGLSTQAEADFHPKSSHNLQMKHT